MPVDLTKLNGLTSDEVAGIASADPGMTDVAMSLRAPQDDHANGSAQSLPSFEVDGQTIVVAGLEGGYILFRRSNDAEWHVLQKWEPLLAERVVQMMRESAGAQPPIAVNSPLLGGDDFTWLNS